MFAVAFIHDEDETAFAEVSEQVLAVPLKEQRLVRGIVIPHVVVDLLPMPLQLARFRIQRQDRVGVEIVAIAILAIEVGAGIAGPVENRVRLRVVAAGQPRAATAELPGFAGPALGVVLDRLELPQLLARVRLDPINFPRGREFATGRSEGQHVVGDDWGRGEVAAATFLEISELDRPELLAGLLVERY